MSMWSDQPSHRLRRIWQPESAQSMSEPLYHITDRESWQRAIRTGSYSVDSLDQEGFIHCSLRHQVTRVANALYTDRANLLLLEIDHGAIQAVIRLEGESEQFPHIYGVINLSAVTRVASFEPARDGSFAFPPDFA